MAGRTAPEPPREGPSSWRYIEGVVANGLGSAHELPVPRRDVYRLLGRLHRKRLVGIARGRGEGPREIERVAEIYRREYLPPTADFVRKRAGRRDVFLVNGRPLCVDGWFTFAYRSELIARALSLTGARTVLEVGSGRGILLALLALRDPKLELSGIDLAAEGVARSRELATDPPPEVLRLSGVDRPTSEHEAALAALSFTQGDAARMPFADDAFDVSYTCLSLEQMPQSVTGVLREMARVTRSYCVFLEPFADANGPLGMAQLRALDYFRGSSESFREFGLEPVFFTRAIPQKVRFKTGLLVARVARPANEG